MLRPHKEPGGAGGVVRGYKCTIFALVSACAQFLGGEATRIVVGPTSLSRKSGIRSRIKGGRNGPVASGRAGMAAKDRGRGPLVADKRYASSRAAPSGGGPKKPAPPPRQPRKRVRAARPRRQHGFLVGLVLAIWRVLWGIAWRGTAIGALILGGFVW